MVLYNNVDMFRADFVVVFLSSFLVVLLILWLMNPTHLPPGPWGWPILGYLPNLGIAIYLTGKEPYRLFSLMSNRYGKVFSLYMGSKLVVVLNNYESIREAFMNPHLNDRPILHGYPDNDGGVLLASGKTWRHQRRFTLSQFRNFGIGKSSFEDKISEEVSFLRRELQKYSEKSVDPSEMLSHSVSNIICAVIFGQRYEYTDEKFLQIVNLLRQQFELAGDGSFVVFIPMLQHFCNGSKRCMSEVSSAIRSFINTIVDCHRKIFDSENMSDYIDAYLNELDLQNRVVKENGCNPSPLSDHNLCRTITQLFAAGTETTVTSMLWCVLYMMAYPKVQSKIQEELDEVVGRNRLPRIDDKLPYTQATIMEVQRIATIVPLGVPHIAARDCTLDGHEIPEGTMLLANIWAVHHDSEIWKEPNEFMPERFFDENGNLFQPKEYIPFSLGRRECLGENLAKMELFIIFTHLLHQFTFKKPSDMEEISFKPKRGATNSPVPFKAVIIERL